VRVVVKTLCRCKNLLDGTLTYSSMPSCGMFTASIDLSVLVDPTMNPSHLGLRSKKKVNRTTSEHRSP
jgi:hypothetical protein